jgi:hypothetical protein
MYTSMLLLALSGFAPSTEPADAPAWRTDYLAARQAVAREEKPLAVVFGSGGAGWKQLAREGELGNEARRILGTSYVCLYVNVETENGQRQAEAFGMQEKTGIVISDVTGAYQAFRHQGTLDDEHLVADLQRYADPNRVVRTTETNPESEYRSHYDAPAGEAGPSPAYYRGGCRT